MNSFTLDELADALERNGVKQIRNGQYISYDDQGTATGACAVGQIALNLDISPHEAYRVLNDNGILVFDCPAKSCKLRGFSLGGALVHINDDHGWTFSSMAKWLRKQTLGEPR